MDHILKIRVNNQVKINKDQYHHKMEVKYNKVEFRLYENLLGLVSIIHN
jgi:hypothetical protein